MARVFTLVCWGCGKRRGFLPARRHDGNVGMLELLHAGLAPSWAGVLICSTCDYNHAEGTVIPREAAVRDIERKS